MPLIYNQTDILLGLSAPFRTITTPSKSTGIQVLNAANITLNVQTPTGAVPVPPNVVYNIPINENEQITFNVSQSGVINIGYIADFVDVQYSFDPHFTLSVSALPVSEASLTSTIQAPGSASPSEAIQVGGTDGTNLRVLATDTLGRLEITSTGTLTDASGTITAGGTAQAVFAAKADRRYLLIQNNSSGPLWINFTTTAVEGQPSIQLSSGGTAFVMETGFVSTEAVSIIGATTGQAFTAKEA